MIIQLGSIIKVSIEVLVSLTLVIYDKKIGRHSGIIVHPQLPTVPKKKKAEATWPIPVNFYVLHLYSMEQQQLFYENWLGFLVATSISVTR